MSRRRRRRPGHRAAVNALAEIERLAEDAARRLGAALDRSPADSVLLVTQERAALVRPDLLADALGGLPTRELERLLEGAERERLALGFTLRNSRLAVVVCERFVGSVVVQRHDAGPVITAPGGSA